MEYILLGIVIVLIYLLIKEKNNKNNSIMNNDISKDIRDTIIKDLKNELLTEVNENTIKILCNLENKINKDLLNFNESVQNKLDFNLGNLTNKVESNLDKNISRLTTTVDERSNKNDSTFEKLNEKLIEITKAQENIESLSSNILSLQDILNNNKQRGILGEIQLYQVLNSVYGENKNLYSKQYKLSNGSIVDSILFAPKPLGNICIDSKFPLENYKKTQDNSLNKLEKEKAKKDFILNMKKHIDDIANKYIINYETSDQAIIFIPSESIFAELYTNYYEKVIEYAHIRKIWVTSPTTLIALLGLLQGVTKDIEIKSNVDNILKDLKYLSEEFVRFEKRWTDLSKTIEKVNKTSSDLGITTSKITKKFNTIINE